ncbi:MAG: hypothetical protein JXM69_02995, partial [Anaerolineae bacterium]|nr:hypothetical protein [Anaerolineae bacterium]
EAGVEPAVEPELEIPDWLGETEPESPTPVELADELELEIPAWLTGAEETAAEKASEAGVEPAVEPELEIPDWLGEIGPEVPTSSDEFAIESDLEMPAWLLETEETPVEATPAAFEPEAETEAETPFWLGELPEVELAERMSAEFSAETEIEMPDWLSGVEEIPAEEIPPDAGTKSEMPAWLAELPEAQPEELPSPPVEPAPRAEVEMPAWSSGMEETTAEETPETFVEPPAVTEPELPSWLRELREVDLEATLPGAEAEASTPVPAEPMAGPELEKPAWLSEIEQEAPPKELPAAPAEPTSAVEAETAAVEPEIPSWLRELPEVETEEEVPEIVEPVDRAEAGMPDWLPGVEEVSADQLPAEPTVETDAELPPWLVELQGAETGKPEPAPVEPPAEAELEMPSWLSGVEQVPTEESPPAPVEPPADITAETPAWLSELSGAEPEFPTKLSPEPAAEPEGEMPAWLSGIGPAEPASTEETPFDRTEPAPEAETEIPAWLFGVEEAPDEQPSVESAPEEETELPPWLTELPDADSEQPPEADTEAEMPDWLSGIMETSSEKPPPEIPAEPETETDWLFEEEPPLPPWLAESPETETDKGRIKPANLDDVSSDSSETMGQRGEETPPDQGWLTGLREATEAVKTVLPPEDADKLEPSSPPPPPTTDKPDAPESKDADPGGIKASQASAPSPTATSPTAGPPSRGPVSGWLQALKPAPTAEMVVEAEDSQAAESTGVLAGLTGLLPVERMVTATPTIEPRINGHNGHAEAVLKAAQDFYTIATQPPQPATLPAPVARQSGPISSNVIRAGLFLLFIILVALPLLPGLQRGTPWTEPADELNDVLGDRRRQMIGEQLGVIDVQQPDSVALVSFDYSTATQGEMQPLAEAIIGRLKGQGMRVIFISLEPEGAALAQEVLDQKRAEAYGVNMVNLGYLPGQAAAIRALVTGQASLSTKRDFKEGYTFADPERTHWGDVDNLGQVDLIVTLADNPATARWWIEQLHMVPPPDGRERFLLAATSAVAAPFLQPYRDSNQLDGLISGINGAAAVEASRQQFGPARQMLDSQSIAHLLIIILIAAGTVAGWMPRLSSNQSQTQPEEID